MAFRLVVLIALLGCSNAKTRFVDQYYTCEMGFFVSTTQVQGNIGVANADAQCTALAGKVGDCAKRPWRAYLSTSGQNARDRIGNGPWYNLSGQLFSANLQSLFSTAPQQSLFLTETGTDASAFTVWTGSTNTGTVAANTCSDFTLNSGQGQMGTPQSFWSDTTNQSCGNSKNLYCFASD